MFALLIGEGQTPISYIRQFRSSKVDLGRTAYQSCNHNYVSGSKIARELYLCEDSSSNNEGAKGVECPAFGHDGWAYISNVVRIEKLTGVR
jgi:hypothetical protein